MSRLLSVILLLVGGVASAVSDEPLRYTVQRGAPTSPDAGVQDCYIWQESPAYNGNSSTLYTGLVGTTDKVAFLRFDVSELPASIDVLEARVVLEAIGASGVPITVHPVTMAWTETEPTWANFSTNYKPDPIGTFTPRAGRNVVDVTGAVRAWVEGGSSNHGLALRQAPLTSSSTFYSSDSATVSWRPQLEVLYREPRPLVSLALPATPLEAACATEFTYPLRAHAPEATSFTSADLPEGISLDPTTGELRWSPTRGDKGERAFTVAVTDGKRQADLGVTLNVKCSGDYEVGCSASPAMLGLALVPLLLRSRRRR